MLWGRAVEQGYAPAAEDLAKYATPGERAGWLARAAGLGSSRAASDIGTLYEQGNAAMPSDLDRARHWYAMAHELGDVGVESAIARVDRAIAERIERDAVATVARERDALAAALHESRATAAADHAANVHALEQTRLDSAAALIAEHADRERAEHDAADARAKAIGAEERAETQAIAAERAMHEKTAAEADLAQARDALQRSTADAEQLTVTVRQSKEELEAVRRSFDATEAELEAQRTALTAARAHEADQATDLQRAVDASADKARRLALRCPTARRARRRRSECGLHSRYSIHGSAVKA